MNEAAHREVEQILAEHLLGIENLTYEQAFAWSERVESAATVAGKTANVLVWREQVAPTKCLVAVSVSVRRGRWRLFDCRWERGWLFTPSSPARVVDDPETEIDG